MKLNCPNCNSRLNIPDRLAGKKGRRPKCLEIIGIPIEVIETLEIDISPFAKITCSSSSKTNSECPFLGH